MTRRITVLTLLAMLGGCVNSDSVSDSSGSIIGAQGGTLTSADGRATLDIPAGALAGDVTFVVTDAQLVPSAQYLLAAFDFQPDGTQFLVPATLTFSYDPATLPAGLPSQLSVATEVNGAWMPLPTTHDPVAMTISATITHFSVYAAGAFGPTGLDRQSVDSRAVVNRGAYVFVTTADGLEVYEHRLFPIEDLRNIASLPLGSAWDIAVEGDRLVVTTTPVGGGLRLHVIDVQDPSNPIEVGTPLDVNDPAIGHVAADGDRAVLGGMFVHLIDTSPAGGPMLLHTFPQPFELILDITMRTDAATLRSHAYVGRPPSMGVGVFEVVAGASLAPRPVLQYFGPTEGVKASGDFLYVMEGNRLIILDVSVDPETPPERSSTVLPHRERWTKVPDLDTPNPDDFECLLVEFAVRPFQLACDGDLLYVAGGLAGGRVVDVSNPAAPVILREPSNLGTCAGTNSTDPPDPGTTLEPGNDTGLLGTTGIAADGRYAFVAYGSGVLRLIQVFP